MTHAKTHWFDDARCRPLDIHVTSYNPIVDSCMYALIDLMDAKLGPQWRRGHANRDQVLEHLKVVTLELFRRRNSNGLKFGIRYSRDKRRWNKKQLPERYNALGLRRVVLVQIIDGLTTLGFIEHWGGRTHPTRRWQQSRMRAKAPMLKLLKDHGVTVMMIERARNEETVFLSEKRKLSVTTGARLKHPVKQRLTYTDTPQAVGMRSEIDRYKNLLAAHRVEHPKTTWPPADVLNLYRVFNNSPAFDLGGRLYWPPWQQLSEKERAKVLLDGQPTVELDFSCYQIRLLYARHGIDYADDGYRLPRFSGKLDRQICKKLVLAVLNADSERSALQAVHKWFRQEPKYKRHWKAKGIKLRVLLDALIDKHKPIATDFCTGIGLKLMKQDADICMAIIDQFVRQDKPILTVHDSFIVKQQDKGLLKQTMKTQFEYKTGITVSDLDCLIH